MKKVMGNVKRSLSILLAIAMVITMMPQTAMPVYAAEPGMEDASGGSPQTDDLENPSDPETGTLDGVISDEGQTPSENESETPPEGDIPGNNDENNNNGDGADDGLNNVIPEYPNAGSNEPGTGDDPDADDVITIMGDPEGDIMPVAEGDKTYTISFPATQTGYTLTDGNGDSLEEAEKTWTVATEGAQPYVFGLKLLEGYKNPVVTAKIGDNDISSNITKADPGEENVGYYKYTIGTAAVGSVDSGSTIDITITVAKVYTLTVNDSAVDGIGSLTYATELGESEEKTNFVDDIPSGLAHGDAVYVKFKFDNSIDPEDQDDYEITLKSQKTGSTTNITLLKKEDGTGYYKIVMEDNYTLTVTATRTKYNVTVVKDNNVTFKWDIVANKYGETLPEGNKFKIATGKPLYFGVLVESPYKVTTKGSYEVAGTAKEFSYGNATVDGTAYKTGSIGASLIKGDVTINISTEIDVANAYHLTLARPDGVSSNKSYSVKFYPATGGSFGAKDTIEAGTAYSPVDGKLTTVNDTFYAVITAGDNYDFESTFFDYKDDNVTVTEVTNENVEDIEGLTEIKNTEKALKIEYKGSANLILTINVKGKASTEEREIVFSNKSSSLTYAFVGDSNISKRTGTSNTYTAAAEATELIFTVTANSGYKPTVKYTAKDETTAATEAEENDIPTTDKSGKKTYQYVIPVSALAVGNAIVEINGESDGQTFQVVYDDEAVDIAVRIGAKTVAAPDDTDTEEAEPKRKIDTYAVPHGQTITITGTAKDNCQITKVEQKQSSNNKNISVSKLTSFEVAITADAVKNNADITIDVDSKKLYWANLKKSEDTEDAGTLLADGSANTEVDYGGKYELQVFEGADGDSAIAFGAVTAELRKNDSKKTLVAGNEDLTGVATLDESGKDKVTLDISKATTDDIEAAGNNLTVMLYDTETITAETKPVTTYTFKVRSKVTKVEVRDVSNKKTITSVDQTANTTREYPLKLTPSDANAFGDLKVDPAEGTSGIKASIDAKKGVLVITTPAKAEKVTEEITISSTVAEVSTKLTVNSVQQLLDNKAPTVKLASSDDTTLNLTLTAPSGVEQVKGKAQQPAGGAGGGTGGDTGEGGDGGGTGQNGDGQAQGVAEETDEAEVETVYYAITVKSAGEVAGNLPTFSVSTAKENVEKILTKGEGDNKYTVFYVPLTGATQPVSLKVIDAESGSGDAWKFTATAQLIQTTGKVDAETNNGKTVSELKSGADITVLAESKVSDENTKSPFQTRRPYYADTLKLTKKATTIYTGQGLTDDPATELNESTNGIVIATANFGANTTFAELYEAVDTTYNNANDGTNGSLKLTVVGDTVYAKAYKYMGDHDNGGSYTAPGKHKITVYAEAATNMTRASATIDVTVVQGIEDLKISVPSISIYKENKKAATLKPTVTSYNENEKAYTPKTKKVTWSIVKNKEGEALGEDDSIQKSIDAKLLQINTGNGTITVAKDYVVKTNAADNTFCIKATAFDYGGNVISDISDPITITADMLKIGEVVIAKETKDDDDGTRDVLLSNSNPKTTVESLTDTRVYVLKPGTLDKGFKVEAEDNGEVDIIDYRNFTFTSSNKAAVEVDAQGNITAHKPGTVKITAAANDGSKAKSILTITVDTVKAEKGSLGLKITGATPYFDSEIGEAASFDTENVKDFTFSGTAGSMLNIHVVELVKNPGAGENPWKAVSDYTDFKVAVSNGKLLTTSEGEKYNDQFKLVVTKNPAKITLSYTDKENNKTTHKVIYNITNTGYTVPNKKAPKVALTEKNATLKPKFDDSQNSLGITVTPPTQGDSFKGKLAKVEIDMSAANAKTLPTYLSLDKSLLGGNSDTQIYTLDAKNQFTLPFGELTGEDEKPVELPAGTYKLKVTVGEWGDASRFTPLYPAAALSVKVAAVKTVKGSFKMVTGYTLSASDSWAEFDTSKSKQIDEVRGITFGELLNANIKGVENKFLTYFEPLKDKEQKIIGVQLNSTPEGELMTRLGKGEKLEDIITDKNDLIGYVPYTAYYGQNPTVEEKGTMKITISLKKGNAANPYVGVRSYAVSSKLITVLNDTDPVSASFGINVTVNKKPVPAAIAYVAAEDALEGNDFNSVYNREKGTDNPENGKNYSISADGKTITLSSSKSREDTKTGKHNITLYVIPEDSVMKGYIDALNDDEDTGSGQKAAEKQLAAIKKYGIKLTTAIEVKDAENDERYAKLVLKTNKVKFENKNYSKDANGNYYAEVGYTLTGSCEIDKIVLAQNADAKYGNITFEADNENGLIHAYVTKKGMQAINEYGKTKSVPVIVAFKGTDKAAEGVQYRTQNLTFSVTLPKTAPAESELLYDLILANIEGRKADIMKLKSLPDQDEWASDADKRKEQYEAIVEEVVEKVNAYIPAESDVTLNYYLDQHYYDDQPKSIDDYYQEKAETATTDGSITVNLRLVDLQKVNVSEGGSVTYNSGNSQALDYELKINRRGYEPSNDTNVVNVIKSLVTGIGTDTQNITISNKTTATEVITYLRTKAAAQIDSVEAGILKLYIADFKQTKKATENDTGEFTFSIIVVDSLLNRTSATIKDQTITIPTCDGLQAAKTKITKALEAVKGTNKEEDAERIEKEISDAINGAINNDAITWDWDTHIDIDTPASVPDAGDTELAQKQEHAGSWTGKIMFYTDGEADSAATDITIVIDPLRSETEITEAVEAVQEGIRTFANTASNANSVKQEVLKVAGEAIKEEPYTVQIKKENGKEQFAFTAAKWNTEGKLSYTLAIVPDGTGKTLDVEQELYTIPVRSDLWTLANAKATIDNALNKTKENGKITAWNAINVDGDLAAAKATVESILKGYISANQNIHVVVMVTKFVPATPTKGMELTFEWYLTREGENPTKSTKVTVTTAPSKSEDAVKAAVTKAVAEMDPVTISQKTAEDPIDEEEKKDAEDAIIAAAESVLPKEGTTVEVKSDDSAALKLTTAATVNALGEAGITLEVTLEGVSPVEVPVTCKVKELDQKRTDAFKAANIAVEAITNLPYDEKYESADANECVRELVIKKLEDTDNDSAFKWSAYDIEVLEGDYSSESNSLTGKVKVKILSPLADEKDDPYAKGEDGTDTISFSATVANKN